jgi:branched-chain amino acid transport system ATP-binding protein
MSVQSSLLEVRGISLSFAGVKALSDVSFDVSRAEILAIIGPNGAGKSSLLNVVNGLYRAQHGSISFDGRRRERFGPRDAARAGIARTFQNLALFKGMTVLENALTGRVLKTRSGLFEHALSLPSARREERAQREYVLEILRLLELSAVRDSIVSQLPYGLQKRVELARALSAEPKLLLLDEPMAGMNQHEKQEMSRFILDANEQLGTSVVLIEHDIGVVMDISDRIVVLDYGRKIADGTPQLIRQDSAVIAAYLGAPTSERAA